MLWSGAARSWCNCRGISTFVVYWYYSESYWLLSTLLFFSVLPVAPDISRRCWPSIGSARTSI
jgi:hypothetical protein